MTKTAEYKDIKDEEMSTRTVEVMGEAVRIHKSPTVELARYTAGWELAGSCARWTDGGWSVRWFDGSAFHGQRWSATPEGETAARAYYLRLTTPEKKD